MSNRLRFGGAQPAVSLGSIPATVPVAWLTDVDEEFTEKGGKGSGHHQHAGRPGKRGGSLPGKGGASLFAGGRKSLRDDLIAAHGLQDDVPADIKGIRDAIRQVTEVADTFHGGYTPGFFDAGSKHWILDENRDVVYVNLSEEDSVYLKELLSKRQYVLKMALQNAYRDVLVKMDLPTDVDEYFQYLSLTDDIDSDENRAERDRVLENLKNQILRGYDPADPNAPRSEDVDLAVFDLFHRESERFGDDEYSGERLNVSRQGMAAMRAVRDAMDFKILSAVSSGELSIEDGERLADRMVSDYRGGAEWKNLPETLYHVTVSADAIRASGLKSRYQIQAAQGVGGGDTFAISTTENRDYAVAIEQAFHEAHHVATGKITLGMLLDSAAAGGGKVGKPWSAFAIFEEKRPMVNELLEREKAGTLTDKDRDNIFHWYTHEYLWERGNAGGFENPMFWASERSVFASLDPDQFKTLELKPKRDGARGIYLPAEYEYRIFGSDTVTINEYLDTVPDNVYEMLGIKT